MTDAGNCAGIDYFRGIKRGNNNKTQNEKTGYKYHNIYSCDYPYHSLIVFKYKIIQAYSLAGEQLPQQL